MTHKPTHHTDAALRLEAAALKRADFVRGEPERAADAAVVAFENRILERAKGLENGHTFDTSIDLDVECAKSGLAIFTKRMEEGGYVVTPTSLETHNTYTMLVNITVNKNPPKQYAAWPFATENK